jgi:hypothetical protein
VFGDTIYVANGDYEEQVVMIPGLSLIGAGTDSCIVDSRSLVSAWDDIAMEVADSCLLKGFKIKVSNNLENGMGIAGPTSSKTLVTQNRVTSSRWGIFLEFYNTVNNLTTYNNILDEVVYGIWIFNSNSLVRNNIIYTTSNTQYDTRGIDIGGFASNYSPFIDSNYIDIHHGTGIYKELGARPTITNNTIRFTQFGADAIFLSQSDTAIVYNNLIINRTGAGGIYNNSFLHTKLHNNYIVGNSGAYGIHPGPNDEVKNNVVTNANKGIDVINPNPIITHNNSWNNVINFYGFTPDTTNLSVDPMVVNDDTNQGDLDFHLQMFSPLIDAGDPNILDKDGSRSDIGLYGGPYGESYVYVDLPPRTPVNLTASFDSNIVTLKWNKNTEADFGYYKIFYDTTKNFQVDSTKLISSQTDTFYYFVILPETDSLYFKLTAVDNQGNESNPSEEVGVIVTSVEDEWKPVNNYILYQNYPNPFNPSTKIGYKLKERGYVKLYVYDVKGELVSVLVNKTQEAGYYEIEFDAGSPMPDTGIRNLASGIYIYQIFVSNENRIPVFSDIKKMVYVK